MNSLKSCGDELTQQAFCHLPSKKRSSRQVRQLENSEVCCLLDRPHVTPLKTHSPSRESALTILPAYTRA